MTAAVHPETQVTLADGSVITLREVRPDDKDAIAAGFAALSPESRYRRFFTAMSRLSGSDLRYLTEVDHADHEAVLGFTADGEPVGVARYVRGDIPEEAEVAVAVVDAWRVAAPRPRARAAHRAGARERHRALRRLGPAGEDEALELFRSVAPVTRSRAGSCPGRSSC